ncbi:MAG: hypothetical protein AB7O52_05040 [Planctomycetota bacterium]
MAEINLEAQQVVGEEKESAPKGKRKLLKDRKGIFIFAGVVVVEAVVLFALFELMGGGAPETNADGATPEAEAMAPKDLIASFAEDGLIELGDVSITIDNSGDPRVDRRVTLPMKIQVTKETADEIAKATEQNENAIELLKQALQSKVREYLLGEGIQKLQNPEIQKGLNERLKSFLIDELPQLKDRVKHVYVGNISFSRY